MVTAWLNVIVMTSVPASIAAGVPVPSGIVSQENVMPRDGVFCTAGLNAAMLFSVPEAPEVWNPFTAVVSVVMPPKVTVVVTPPEVFVATVALPRSTAFHVPVLVWTSNPSQPCPSRARVSTGPVAASSVQFPPRSAAPVSSIDAATSALVARASASMKVCPVSPAAMSHP